MNYDDAMIALTAGMLMTRANMSGDFIAMDVSKSGIIPGVPMVIYEKGISAGGYVATEEDEKATDWAVFTVAQD
ncbi:TPA: hypothetical protein ACJ2PN_005088 [Klebsiella pneumoniae]|uniref:hypothetical protein n=1 Tax=Klebsiella quasipneumoniae TaxID=1463165 RepID=UPI002294E053|nr:hypothetical protein [Klebsiella quasipneumoniae]HBZ1575136.1 hypothetical protein [Klebsiella pneumoniae]MDV0850872.1 hypothetical protein [Klebsiella quasipneumoniae subsp. similipneumoniae]MDV0890450.1 hypothetical protein [Klebsiella quasipneumoniae subsp. similipneumoniae]HCB0272220.1 hypothetical protein [Klebsiella pneumoniae]HCT5331130.1 hypothetical protein [Klebsiella pneumoniae]